MIEDEAVAWDNPATVVYQKRRRRKTAVQAAICFALIFLIAQLSTLVTALAGLFAAINIVLFLATLGFLSAYARLSLRERTLRTSPWSTVEVTGHPFVFLGIPLGTALEIADAGAVGNLKRIATFRAGAELLDASRAKQTIVKAGSGRGLVLARTSGTPVVLARRIGPSWLKNFVWVMASEKRDPQ